MNRSQHIPTIGWRSIKDLSSSTSEFTENDLIFLNIGYEDRSLFEYSPKPDDIAKYDYFFLQNFSYLDLMDLVKKKSTNETERKMISIANYLFSVLEVTEETVTNDFVSFILSELQLNLSPFRLRHEKKYIIRMPKKEMVSIPDLSVEDKNTILLVDEDKSLYNVDHTSAWGENQIAGEIFTALYRNYSNDPSNHGTDHPVYAIRVIGTFFTFYKASASEEYLKAVSRGDIEEYEKHGKRRFHLTQNIIIGRYPPNAVKRLDHFIPSAKRNYVGLNYLDQNDRREIVSLLLSLKSSLEHMELVF